LSALLDAVDASEEAVAAALQHRVPRLLLLPSGVTKLISKQSRPGSYRKALAIFSLLPRFGVAADLPLFNAALGACEAGRDVQQAQAIYRGLKAAGHEPDSITFKVLAATAAKSSDWLNCSLVRLRLCLVF
jgi:hypothetical protein